MLNLILNKIRSQSHRIVPRSFVFASSGMNRLIYSHMETAFLETAGEINQRHDEERKQMEERQKREKDKKKQELNKEESELN